MIKKYTAERNICQYIIFQRVALIPEMMTVHCLSLCAPACSGGTILAACLTSSSYVDHFDQYVLAETDDKRTNDVLYCFCNHEIFA
jgi:hypothetical protein